MNSLLNAEMLWLVWSCVALLGAILVGTILIFRRSVTASSNVKPDESVTVPFDVTIETRTIRVANGSSLAEDVTAKYLVFDKRYSFLTARYGGTMSEILVRQCYEDLYKLVLERFVDFDKREIADGRALFTGVPGIGKSMFMLYMVKRLLSDERFPDDTVVMQLDTRSYHVFKRKASGAITVRKVLRSVMDEDWLADRVLLVDQRYKIEVPACGRLTMIFSSPNPDRYKETMKGGNSHKYYVPVWTKDELRLLPWYNNEDADKGYQVHGGLPRYIKEYMNKMAVSKMELDALFEGKGANIAEKFFKHGFGGTDEEVSHRIFHLHPMEVTDPKTNTTNTDYTLYTYSFASDYIWTRFQENYLVGLHAECADVFNAGLSQGTWGGASAGNLFEKLVLWTCPLAGQRLNVTCLKGSTARHLTEGQMEQIVVPAEVRLLPARRDGDILVQTDSYYTPAVSNFASGDCFYLAPIPNTNPQQYELTVFQITVGQNHPVKAAGLAYITNLYTNPAGANIPLESITRRRLVFVTPKIAPLDKAQPLHNTKRVVVTGEDIPLEARDFDQFMLRYQVPTDGVPFESEAVRELNDWLFPGVVRINRRGNI